MLYSKTAIKIPGNCGNFPLKNNEEAYVNKDLINFYYKLRRDRMEVSKIIFVFLITMRKVGFDEFF